MPGHRKSGSERESVKSCILRGFPKGTISAPSAREQRILDKWPINRGLAVEMTLRGRDDRGFCHKGCAALEAWKPAKDAGFHIPTATATCAHRPRAGVLSAIACGC
jgi:hypothetical protein